MRAIDLIMRIIFREFYPKIEVLFRKGYSWKEATYDLFSALSIAMVSLPLSIAFAIAAGASPQQGMVCGVVLGFFVSLLGGSRYAIAGPTGAFVVIIFDILARQGQDGLGTAAVMGGIILMIFGLLRLGSFIRFIPFPLIVGFTTALALLILLGQMKDCLGLPSLKEPGFTKLVYHLFLHIKSANPHSILISILTLLPAIFFKAKFPTWPWAVLCIFIATVSQEILGFDVQTLGSKFGSLSLFPWPDLPKFRLDLVPELFSDGFTIAALSGIEALLCCLVADSMTGTRHKSNIELIAQGVGTVATGFLGGIPGTNAISRTGANIRAGGKTPVAGLLHALILVAIFAFAGPLCAKIPLAALSSVLILIAWHMAHFDRFIDQFKAPWPDICVMSVTFLLTIFIDITVAVQIGMIMASLLFVYKQSQNFTLLDLKKSSEEVEEVHQKIDWPKDTNVYQMQGSLFFGAVDRLKMLLTEDVISKNLVLRMDLISEIDATGMNSLKTLYRYLKERDCQMYLVGLQPHVQKAFQRYKMLDIISENFICHSLKEAFSKIEQK
jgi:SulP family sulfate permease